MPRRSPRTNVECVCTVCGRVFYAKASRVEKGNVKYCSRGCMFSDPDYQSHKSESMKEHFKDPAFLKRHSELRKGRKQTDVEKEKRALALRGKKCSQATKDKIRRALVGHTFTDDARSKISNSLKGERNPNFGKPHSPIHNSRISQSQIGKTIKVETRIASVETRIGGFWYGNVRYDHRLQYCEKWGSNLKERVRAFFGYRCVECGVEQTTQKLHVHHVHYNKKMCCDDTPRSLVTLCRSCHGKTNANREYWSSHFQKILDTEYGGRCWISREDYKSMRCGYDNSSEVSVWA